MTDPVNAKPSNPFQTTLLWVGIAGIVVGFALLLLGSLATDYYNNTIAMGMTIGRGLLDLGALSFVAWLVVAALGWRRDNP